MTVLSNEQLAAVIELGVETRAVEFKGPGSTSTREFVATVARACIALANQRDGGHVVIGVVDNNPGSGGGLNAEQLTQWLDADNVLAKINAYADPPVGLRIEQRELPSGAPVVVIEVSEFEQIPVIAARDFGGKITKGQLYTRSMAKPESTPYHSQNELREVLQLATEKQLHAFLRTARQTGLRLETEPDASDRFADEAASFLGDPITAGLPGVPHLRVEMHPIEYREDRLDYGELGEIVRGNAVRMRGWPFPWFENPVNGPEWVGFTVVQRHPETWSLHRSGQFVELKPLPDSVGPDFDGFNGDGPYVPVWFLIHGITEAAIFATRLQASYAPAEPFVFKVVLVGARGWELVVADPGRSGFHSRYAFGSDEWSQSVDLPPGIGVEEAKEIAAEMSREMLLRFGWNGVTLDIIRGLQLNVIG